MNKTRINKDIFEELLFYNKFDISSLASAIGVPRQTLYRYKNNKITPSINIAIKLCKVLNCRIVYLLGLDDDYDRKFGNGEYNFLERFNIMLKLRNVTKYRIAKAVPLPESMIYNWLYNGTTPSLDSVVRLAQYFQCSVDYLLGYDNEIL